MHWCSLRIERRRSIDEGCHNGHGDAAPVAPKCEVAPSAPARELDAGQPSRARSPTAAVAHSIDS